jgi:hypothetical protein
LFGGFEDLNSEGEEDDEDEYDELPLTAAGYAKDGFVVDSSDTEEETSTLNTQESEENNSEENEGTDETELDNDIVIEDLGSELSEESYDYETDKV